MKRLLPYLIAFAVCFSLAPRAAADELLTFDPGNGEVDSLYITLNPIDGTIDGVAGSIIGWGFSATWTAEENYLSFTGSALTSQTNNSFLSSYSDYIGMNSAPDSIAMAPNTTWTETFDSTQMTGVGAYSLSSDPSLALPGATDTGTIQFSFEVYYGYPTDPDAEDLGGFTYSSDTTAYTVTVDAPPDSPDVPEPSSFVLGLAALAGIAAFAKRGRAFSHRTE